MYCASRGSGRYDANLRGLRCRIIAMAEWPGIDGASYDADKH